MTRFFFVTLILVLAVMITPAFAQSGTTRVIAFGTTLDPQAVMSASQQLAKSLANPNSAQWQAKGDQHRTYHCAETNTDEPYRIYVPTNWDGKSKLPLVMYLHGAGSNENTYLDMNNKQMINLAQARGYLLVSPLGAQGAYGNFLRLSAPFGNAAGAAQIMAQVTTESERINQLSEKDVINVLELVLNEYPVDRAALFLAGHSMGSGGTWYIGGKYANYWKGIAPMSGPFVQESGYTWDAVRRIYIFVTEGIQTPSIDASRLLRDWLKKNGFNAEYEEVNADHGGMINLVLPNVFGFFDRYRNTPATATPTAVPTPTPTAAGVRGDVNGDGIINIVDALLIAQFSVGQTPPNFNSLTADVNCSGAIDIIDALLIAQLSVGLITGFPCS